MPDVFISYSQEDEEHKEWVRSLADRLLENGINAIVDQYDALLGDRLPQFMEQSITNADYVLIICTPTYKEKADKREGGVGYEGHIITGELYTKGNERKFIPILRKGTISNAMPVWMAGKLAINLENQEHYEENFNDLLTTLNGISKKPSIKKMTKGKSPVSQSKDNVFDNDEPIKILGIITDKVTVPRMDGTRGSALYKIPFRLSREPSELWKKIFIDTWNLPPQFSTMHRPGIASVHGDEIWLNGTTIEEVRDYHRETLMLCVDVANKKEADIIEKEKQRKEQEDARRQKHFDDVNNIAKDIKF